MPPLPESLTPQQVSPYSSEHYDGEVPSEKLIAHLGTKNHIVNHFVEIQQAIKQGEVIDKIHRILRFRQAPFAKEYVTLNNNQRIIASKNKDEFGKTFFKLMNNSCFGQLMMDEKRFKHGKFVSSRKKKKIRGFEVSERKLAISDQKCIDYYDLDEDKENSFVLMNQKRTLTRPIACGCSIFGMSKSYIIEMWYKLIDKFGAENIHLIFTDTDSLCFELTGRNYHEADLVYHHIKNDPEFASLFDLRDIPDVPKEAQTENPYWSMKNESVMGKFKFEVLGIGEIGADKPKSYSILLVELDKNGEEIIKTKVTAKGIYSCCIDDDSKKRNKLAEEEEGGVVRLDEKKALIRHLDMIACVKEGTKALDVYAMTIETIHDTHLGPLKMATRLHWKQTFTAYDDKRYHRQNDYHSLAYGHSEAMPLVSLKETISNYREYQKEHKEEIRGNERLRENRMKELLEKFQKIFKVEKKST